MSIIIYSHPDCVKHEMGAYHPESPERLKAIYSALKQQPWASHIEWQESPQATKEQLKRVHDADYVDELFNVAPKKGYLPLDPDTMMNAYSLSAALHAAGALTASVDAVFEGKAKRVFCAVRPPGHHAEPAKAMGFCFFNNIAVGVRHAIAAYDCQRVAIVDFDVHHGNGTESMFSHETKVCFWSSFQHPFYPGAQIPSHSSSIHLCPLKAGTSSLAFRQKVDDDLIPLLSAFKPECIFISAGFDAHHLDPLANLNLTTQDYGYITQAVCQVANTYSKGRVISTLEGGYNLSALSESVVEHVNALRA